MSPGTVEVTAKRWRGGWELWNGDDCWTQVSTLDRARQQVVDYLDTVEEGVDHSDWDIRVVPDIPNWTAVQAAREATREAAAVQVRAADLSRQAVRALREDGFSVTDAAAIMGVSRGRISQLAKGC